MACQTNDIRLGVLGHAGWEGREWGKGEDRGECGRIAATARRGGWLAFTHPHSLRSVETSLDGSRWHIRHDLGSQGLAERWWGRRRSPARGRWVGAGGGGPAAGRWEPLEVSGAWQKVLGEVRGHGGRGIAAGCRRRPGNGDGNDGGPGAGSMPQRPM